MEKTYSQKVAGALEVVSYLLLIPAAFGLIYGALSIFIGLKGDTATPVLLGLIPFALAAVGITLLVGYYKHARGRLDKKRVPALWAATAAFNALLALPWAFGFLSIIASIFREPRANGAWNAVFLSGTVVYIYGAITYYALQAYASEKTGKFR